MPVCDICEVDWIWYPCSGHQTEMCVEFLFNQIGKSAQTFSTGQSWHILKSWYTGRGPKQGFPYCLADGLSQNFTEFHLWCRLAYKSKAMTRINLFWPTQYDIKVYLFVIPGMLAFSKTATASCLSIEVRQPLRWSSVTSGSNIGIYLNNIKAGLCPWRDPKFLSTRGGTHSWSARSFQLFVFVLSSVIAMRPRIPVSSLSTRLPRILSSLMRPPSNKSIITFVTLTKSNKLIE